MVRYPTKQTSVDLVAEEWKKRKVHMYGFESAYSFTEEQLSTLSWIDCDVADFNARREHYKHWNNKVMKKLEEEFGRTIVIRDWCKSKTTGLIETKIFKSTESKLKDQVDRRLNIVTHSLARAHDLAVKNELPVKVFNKVLGDSAKLLTDGEHYDYTEEQAQDALVDGIMAVKRLEAYKNDPKGETEKLASSILDKLDAKPAIAYRDEKMKAKLAGTAKQCKYTEEADKRRNGD